MHFHVQIHRRWFSTILSNPMDSLQKDTLVLPVLPLLSPSHTQRFRARCHVSMAADDHQLLHYTTPTGGFFWSSLDGCHLRHTTVYLSLAWGLKAAESNGGQRVSLESGTANDSTSCPRWLANVCELTSH